MGNSRFPADYFFAGGKWAMGSLFIIEITQRDRWLNYPQNSLVPCQPNIVGKLIPD